VSNVADSLLSVDITVASLDDRVASVDRPSTVVATGSVDNRVKGRAYTPGRPVLMIE